MFVREALPLSPPHTLLPTPNPQPPHAIMPLSIGNRHGSRTWESAQRLTSWCISSASAEYGTGRRASRPSGTALSGTSTTCSRCAAVPQFVSGFCIVWCRSGGGEGGRGGSSISAQRYIALRNLYSTMLLSCIAGGVCLFSCGCWRPG